MPMPLAQSESVPEAPTLTPFSSSRPLIGFLVKSWTLSTTTAPRKSWFCFCHCACSSFMSWFISTITRESTGTLATENGVTCVTCKSGRLAGSKMV